MDDFCLISRGFGPRPSHQTQEELFLRIQTQTNPKVIDVRKLREAITSSKRKDSFALKVYEFSVDVCIEHKDYNELKKSLSILIKEIYKVQTLGDRRVEMCSFYLFILQQDGDMADLISGSRTVLELGVDLAKIKALEWYRYSTGILDYVKLGKIYGDCTPNERFLLNSSIDATRKRILQMLMKSYFQLPSVLLKSYLLLSKDDDWPELTIEFGLETDKDIVQLKKRKIK
jgi:hypothetical protein